MLGHLLVDYFLSRGYEVAGIIEEDCDINQTDLWIRIDSEKPDIIINSYRLVIEPCEADPTRAMYINSFIPKYLGWRYQDSPVRIIHLSTDCVFSGKKGDYSVADIPDGRSIYSLTKYSGELHNSKDLTIRTSYLGPNLADKNEELFDWLLAQSGEVNGYTNAFWNGVTTLELAKTIEHAIKKNISGLYHLGSETKLSKYELLSIIKNKYSLDHIKINTVNNDLIDRFLIDNRKELSISDYDTMFEELHVYMQANRELYNHYRF
jgi:dTDP-4-dehydrorhamnose reductase